jgi:glutamate N-acetyltransferase / amino-acid N-acetyltransferase
MATLLSLVVTDANVEKQALLEATKLAVDQSFNCISVDGDMSTNDTFLLLANGQSNTKHVIKKDSKDYELFLSELFDFTQELAKLIVRDGEGATKFITINVENAHTQQDAKKVANAVATSVLVKTAMFGQDANWGRIICAIGYSGADVDTKKVDLFLGRGEPDVGDISELHLVHEGEPYEIDESIASTIVKSKDISIKIDLNCEEGHSCKMWTSDISHEYVDINASYRS